MLSRGGRARCLLWPQARGRAPPPRRARASTPSVTGGYNARWVGLASTNDRDELALKGSEGGSLEAAPAPSATAAQSAPRPALSTPQQTMLALHDVGLTRGERDAGQILVPSWIEQHVACNTWGASRSSPGVQWQNIGWATQPNQ